MTTCPKCNAKCNPLKFFMVSKWSPYVCKRCKTKSDFPLKKNIILGLVIGLLLGIFSYCLLSKLIGGFNIIVTVILILILIPLIQYYFMDLEKVDD